MSEDPWQDIVARLATGRVGTDHHQRLANQRAVLASLVDSPPLLRELEDHQVLRAWRPDDSSHQPRLLALEAELGIDLVHQLVRGRLDALPGIELGDALLESLAQDRPLLLFQRLPDDVLDALTVSRADTLLREGLEVVRKLG